MAMPGLGGLLLGNAYPPFTLGQSATSAGGSTSASTVTSNTVTAQPAGGSGQFEATWARKSGSTSIVPTSPASLATNFQASMSVGTISAVFACTVLDKVTGETKVTADVTVTLTRGNPPLNVSGPAAIFVQTPSSSPITVSGGTSISISGGSGSYSVSWSSSGDFSISAGGTSCTASRLLSPQGGVQGSVSATVYDNGTGESVTVSAGVTLINNGSAPPPLSISASPSSVAGFGNDGSAATDSVSFVVSGGVGPFSISVGGGPGSVSSPSGSGRSHSTNFTCTGIPQQGSISAGFSATVYDHGTGQSASAGVSAIFYNFGITGPIN